MTLAAGVLRFSDWTRTEFHDIFCPDIGKGAPSAFDGCNIGTRLRVKGQLT